MTARVRLVVACAVLTLAAALWLPASARLSAWGAQGHHIVARIAWARLSPAARERATTMLGGGQDAFLAASTWPDEIRSSRPETSNWHFVDIPVEASHYDAARDCRPTDHGDCIIAAIARARAELIDPGRSDEQRAEALKFVIHLVGDVTSRCTMSTTTTAAATTSTSRRCAAPRAARRTCMPPGIPVSSICRPRRRRRTPCVCWTTFRRVRRTPRSTS